ncbi:DUF6668 family protein [Paeniglutamicibacter sp. NPDC091659]|uniref:DUF6668 family protein n=1 Tax=Paeniglutamicibacter sp. NPDC091659 TaxID=3364389 RepID=UPI003826C904
MLTEPEVEPWSIPAILPSNEEVDEPEDKGAIDPLPIGASPRALAPTPSTRLPCPVLGQPLTWLGCHGGSGATSLERATNIGVALSQSWPNPLLGWPAEVALVCRSNRAGLDAAGRMLHQWVANQIPSVRVVALVVMADAPGRTPRPLARRIRELSGVVPQVHTVPWIPAWRENPFQGSPLLNKTTEAVLALVKQES